MIRRGRELLTYVRPALCIVNRFWESVVKPLVDAARPAVIVEVGAEAGAHTRQILDDPVAGEATLHVIDPEPRFDVDEWRAKFGERLVVHASKSVEVLGHIEAPDLVLIDGDHNWYTVLHELQVLASRAWSEGRPLPIVALHDVGWPYGRRDLYYDPDGVPAAFRQPNRRAGMQPWQGELVSKGGLNPHLHNAIYEHEIRNGVLTAVEDFVEDFGGQVEVTIVPGFHDIAVLVDAERARLSPALEAVTSRLRSPEFLDVHARRLERARLELQIEVSDLEIWVSELTAELEAAKKSAAEWARERAAVVTLAEERKDRLARSRDKAARLEEELAAARAQIAEARAEGEAGRLEAEASRGALETAEERVAQANAATEEAEEVSRGLREELDRVRTERDEARAEFDRSIDVERDLRRELEEVRRRLRDAGPRQETLEEEPPELAARQHFHRRFAASELLSDTALGPYDLASAEPSDTKRLLRDRDAISSTPQGVDIAICVHDALPDLRRCLWSLFAKGTCPFGLIIVDDGSGPDTSEFLSRLASTYPELRLIRNSNPPHGYCIAANLALEESTADYVVLLNSDTVVTPGWLERLVDCATSDRRIGIAGPLSNAASHQSIPRLREGGAWATNPLPDWLTPDAMAFLVERASQRVRPRFPFMNGFCYMISRELLETIGAFDAENFAAGYSEENDYSHRAHRAGFELAVADDAYVFHAKSRSYGAEGRRDLAKEHYARFRSKHGEETIDALVAGLESDTSLAPIRSHLSELLEDEDAFRRRFRELCQEPLRISFVLPGMSHGSGGGVHSIYQEVSALRSLGVPAAVALPAAHMSRAAEAYADAISVFEPYESQDGLIDLVEGSDVVVATHYRSAALLERLVGQRPHVLPAYYIQDYEPFFAPTESPEADEALISYGLVDGTVHFAKTNWLCNVVGRLRGVHVSKVEPSLDRQVYHHTGRSDERTGPLRVAAMVRPRTPRRQPIMTVRTLSELERRHPGRVEVATFGCSDEDLATVASQSRVEPPGRHLGLLAREGVAEVLRSSDLFLDCSIYQAFGRTALEAMACGATAVVPSTGGVHEFARDNENALLVDTASEDAVLAALGKLADDPSQVARLKSCALETAAGYSVFKAALSEYALFNFERGRWLRSGLGERALSRRS